MPYARRDARGDINGLVRWPTPDFLELLPEDHPDVVAYRLPPAEPAPEVSPTRVEDLERALKAAGTLTDQNIIDAKMTRA